MRTHSEIHQHKAILEHERNTRVWELESGIKERSPEDLAAAIVQIASLNAGISAGLGTRRSPRLG